MRAQLLQIFYSIRRELLLIEQLEYNLLFRWFVGFTMDEPAWDATTFTKNRDRPLNHEIARSFFLRVVDRAHGLMSDEHVTVDGTLIEACASQKRVQRKDGKTHGDGKNFHGQNWTNDTHASKTDPRRNCVERTRISMPQDRPGSLNRQATVDVMAYQSQLTDRFEGLREITIIAYRP